MCGARSRVGGTHWACWRTRLRVPNWRSIWRASSTPWSDAWNERDSDKRTELLNASVAPDGSLRDPFAVVVGRDEMSDRIATAHACGSPGRLERSGPVQHCQAAIRFGWRVRHTSGEAVASGTNYAVLSLEAKLRSVVGFWDVLPT